MKENNKNCPFNNNNCDSSCALYIDPEELNETVKNKLASIGIINRETGICSIKSMSLCLNRHIFEQTSGYMR